MEENNEHKCNTPHEIDFSGWTCQECGQVWSPEEVEPGEFSWTKVDEDLEYHRHDNEDREEDWGF